MSLNAVKFLTEERPTLSLPVISKIAKGGSRVPWRVKFMASSTTEQAASTVADSEGKNQNQKQLQ